MRKLLFFITFLAAYDMHFLQATGFITEIINNTDEDIFLNFMDVKKAYPKNFLLLSSQDIKTGDKLGFVNINGNLAKAFYGNLRFPRRTRNIIKDLELPIVSGSYYNGGLNQIYHNSISLEHRLPVSNEVKPLPFVGIRQKGDLLEVITIPCSSGIRNINFDNKLCSNISGGPSHLRVGEKISEGSSYSIEIVQLKNIRYLGQGRHRGKLGSDTFDVNITKNKIFNETVEEVKIQPKAYISTFIPGNISNGVTYVGIKFDGPCTIEFYKKFKTFIQTSFQPDIIVSKDIPNRAEDGAICAAFKFYTIISQEDFQKVLDVTNKQNFNTVKDN